ncbi:MAG: peptidoglycan recognition protein family protein [Oscillospiraceae bacterium]
MQKKIRKRHFNRNINIYLNTSKKFNKKFTIVFLFIVLIVSVIFVVNTSPSKDYVSPQKINGIPMTVDFLSESHPFRPNKERRVKYIVIHETANLRAGSNAKQHNEYIQKNTEREVSWHYTIDDKEIYQHLPDNEVGWHAGDKLNIDGGNLNGIGLELCVNEDGDFEKTKDNAASLVVFLMKQHNLSINSVKQHHDFSGKNCPSIMRINNEWDDFIKLIESKL